jgi:cytohesin
MKTNILLGGILLGAVSFLGAATNDLTTTLQRGLFEEEANQNLGAAIQAYQSVANQFDKDRKLAATAIFRLGECYRKQGNTNEAATYYERILGEFSDQPTLVTLSRQNLAGMASALPAPGQAATKHYRVVPGDVLSSIAKANGLSIEALMVANPGLDSARLRVGQVLQIPPSPESSAAFSGAPGISDAARQEQKRLLEEEIKLVQKELDMKQAQVRGGVIPQGELLTTERDLLHLKRQLAALDAGLPVSIAATEAAAPATSTEADEVRRIQALIKDSPDLINAPDRKGETLLESAAAKGKLAVVKLLLDNGAAVDGLQQPGLTSLHYAAGNGHKAVVDLLLSKGAKAGAQTEAGTTPLHLAARRGYEEVAKALLAAGAPVNAATKASDRSEREDLQNQVGWGQTPLHLAAGAGYRAMVELLLAKGADANVVDGPGQTPLSYAVAGHYQPVVQLLVGAHANPNAGSWNLPVTEAAYYGDMPALKLLLASGAASDINTNVTGDFWQIPGVIRGSGGNVTPLAAAVSQKHADAVAELIRAKADPNRPDRDGNRVIFYALQDPPLLKALLEGGADPNRPDRDGTSPLLRAVMHEAQPAVELLLAQKADPNVGRPQYRWTPLHETAQRGSKGIAEALLKAGADVNAKSRNGWTPLHTAVSEKQREVAELLLANHADPNAKSDIGQTPLHIAVNNGQRELAELLLADKADPNERDNRGRTPLDDAKSMEQQPRPMPGMPPPFVGQGRPMVPGAAPGYPGQPPSVPTTVPVQEAKAETMADLLRRHGALDDLPHLDQIGVRRSATGESNIPFIKGAHDWSQFTLLELIAVRYGLLAARPDQVGDGSYSAASLFFRDSLLPFPDLAHLHISRPAADLKSWQDQVVDLSPVMASGDCAKDVRLRWGDVVEIPEADHPLNEKWKGFSTTELANLKKCLTRKVEIVVKGQTTTVTLAPKITGLEGQREGATPVLTSTFPSSPQYEPTVFASTPFWLRPVLLQSKLVLISSDLSKVKVTRRDPATGQTREWVVDCSKAGESAPGFWLQDGDRIEVPEKS